MLGNLLDQIGSREAFSQLRTVEQLGYIVFMSYREHLRVQSIRFTLQSSQYTAQHLEDRVEVFLEQLEGFIQGRHCLKSVSGNNWHSFGLV